MSSANSRHLEQLIASCVINKHIEGLGFQNRSLGNTGEYFRRRIKYYRNTDLRLPVGQVTVKPVYITITKLMKK
jgi:hypothetical protein